jgi:MFS family permease
MLKMPTEPSQDERHTTPSVITTLLPIMAVVAVAYLVTGIAMPVLPVYVHQELGFSTFVVGLVAGAQFAATLLSRLWAGRFADTRGPKTAVIAGLVFAGAAGLLYILSVRLATIPGTSVTVLLLGRALLGVMESFVITGALSWGLALAGSQHTGTVMSWVGTALYTAYAVGAPAGSGLYASSGFAAVGVATMLLPLATIGLVVPLRRTAPSAAAAPPLSAIVRAIWRPGVALALSGVGFAAITTFVPLLFLERGWSHAWLALTTFSVAFMVTRIAFGHLPDRIGGANVAVVCMVVEALGLAVVWQAPGVVVALTGVALSGLGYALVYPGLGVVAVKSGPPQSRGAAMGTYTAFLDLSLGVASPTLGFIAQAVSLSAVFFVSALVVVATVAAAYFLLSPQRQAYRAADDDPRPHRAGTRVRA